MYGSPYTKETIFGTDSESKSEPCEDRDASGSAVGSSKKPGVRQRQSHRALLTVAQKMEAVKHYQENPGMSYPKLIEWCYKKN